MPLGGPGNRERFWPQKGLFKTAWAISNPKNHIFWFVFVFVFCFGFFPSDELPNSKLRNLVCLSVCLSGLGEHNGFEMDVLFRGSYRGFVFLFLSDGEFQSGL